MCTILESNVLLRARGEFPVGLRVATEEFREGWSRMRSGGVERLERKVHTQGWSFLALGDASQRSGVGETSEAAVACALKQALRRVNAECNAVEVRRIELTHYPWFYVARMHVHPYRIQQAAELPALQAPAVLAPGKIFRSASAPAPEPASVMQQAAAQPIAS
jgi:hypothetical protein